METETMTIEVTAAHIKQACKDFQDFEDSVDNDGNNLTPLQFALAERYGDQWLSSACDVEGNLVIVDSFGREFEYESDATAAGQIEKFFCDDWGFQQPHTAVVSPLYRSR